MTHTSTSQYNSAGTTVKPVRRLRMGRVAAWLALAVVLTLSFVGYLTPQMQVQWTNFMSMCGF